MTEAIQFKYFNDIIEYNAREFGDKPYVIFDKEKISFADYFQMTCRAANGLAAQGAEPGDGVAILMGNCPEYLYLFYGLGMNGIYSVPVNTALKGDGLRFILSHSDVKYLVVDDTLYPKVAELEKPLGSIKNTARTAFVLSSFG